MRITRCPLISFAARSKDLVLYGNLTEIKAGHPVKGELLLTVSYLRVTKSVKAHFSPSSDEIVLLFSDKDKFIWKG